MASSSADWTGLIDTDQTDQAWIPEKNGTASNPEAERRKRQADLTTQLVKFNLTRVQLDRMQDKYVEKSPASEAILEGIDLALAHLHAAPANMRVSWQSCLASKRTGPKPERRRR